MMHPLILQLVYVSLVANQRQTQVLYFNENRISIINLKNRYF